MKIIYSISFIIISVVLFFVFIDPFYGVVKQLRSDMDIYNKALNNSTELQKTRDGLVEKYKSIKQEDKDRLDNLLPNNINNIEFILEMEKIAGLHGMPISDIRSDSDTKSSGSNISTTGTKTNTITNNLSYGVFSMDFTVEAKYDTFISFLKDLEKNLRIIDVKLVSFNPSQISNLSQNKINDFYKYNLKIQTYWLK